MTQDLSTPHQSIKEQQQHEAVVLFYRYLDPKASEACRLLHQHPEFYLDHIHRFQKYTCSRLGLKGRILLAAEGINGTLSATSIEVLQEYRQAMETYDLIDSAGYPGDADKDGKNGDDRSNAQGNTRGNLYIFNGIDWKESLLHSSQAGASSQIRHTEPFANLKVSVVKELVSSGGVISVEDLEEYGGTHLTPEEFHEKIVGPQQQGTSAPPKDVVLIDVRNTFEHAIGRFFNPNTEESAMSPEMVTFSTFDKKFCELHAPALKDKTVLMYCTGGIRCEKASAMLKKRGVEDVYQLQGGIHRYLETFGNRGCFRGRNFQFDQRISLTPSEHYHQRRLMNDHPQSDATQDILSNDKDSCRLDDSNQKANKNPETHEVVGKCMECSAGFDELSGSRICTVCRDLVLVCPTCQHTLREYHCRRHSEWKAYHTFLEVFDKQQLEEQKESMGSLLVKYHLEYSKHVRKTLRKQIEKLSKRLDEIEKNPVLVDPNAPRRCRSCREPGTICNGLCWGFWKTAGLSQPSLQQQKAGLDGGGAAHDDELPILPVHVGDTVRPGPHWNEIRYGNPIHPETGNPLEGTVVEIKSWGTGSAEPDCVAVEWNDPDCLPRRRQIQIYRWGARAVNGTRQYDLQCQ